MSKLIVKWTPDSATPREWTFDVLNPAWDVRYQTELATSWPWEEFVDKLGAESAIALRALLFTLRRRDEPRLSLEAVTIEPGELEFVDVPEPPPAKKTKKADAESGKDASGEA